MPLSRSLRVLLLSLGLTIACAPAVALLGCADSASTKSSEAEEDKPAAKGKDSMDYYRNQMKKGGAAKSATK